MLNINTRDKTLSCLQVILHYPIIIVTSLHFIVKFLTAKTWCAQHDLESKTSLELERSNVTKQSFKNIIVPWLQRHMCMCIDADKCCP